MDPVPLNPGLWEDIPQSAPEAKSAVTDRKLRSSHPALFEIPQQLGPAFGGVPVAIRESHKLFSAVQPGSDHHQPAQPPVGAEPYASVDALHPHVDVLLPREITVRCRVRTWARIPGHRVPGPGVAGAKLREDTSR
jgi:hypothetical protein